MTTDSVHMKQVMRIARIMSAQGGVVKLRREEFWQVAHCVSVQAAAALRGAGFPACRFRASHAVPARLWRGQANTANRGRLTVPPGGGSETTDEHR